MACHKRCAGSWIFTYFILFEMCAAIAHAQGMTAVVDQVLAQAVREIVHPQAQPTTALTQLARRTNRPPSTMSEFLQFMPHLTQIAQKFGVKPPGTKGKPNPLALYHYILNRGVQWLERRRLFGRPGGQTIAQKPAYGQTVGQPAYNQAARQPTYSQTGGQPAYGQTGGQQFGGQAGGNFMGNMFMFMMLEDMFGFF